jgi:predicted nuclease of predicted toxin-antitoxin system
MLRLLIDQNFNQIILRGLRQRIPSLDAVTAHQADLSGATDPDLLAWAADEGRVLVTHDRRTMSDHVADRLAAGEHIAGVVIVSRKLPFGRVIDDLEIIVMCSSQDDWIDIVRHLPL